MKEYKVGLIFNKLQRDGSLSLPGVARQYPKSTSGDKTTWQLDLHTPSADYAARISKLHNYCGQMLHEFKIDEPIPETEGAAMQELSKAYSIARDAHKWLWNRFWHQYVMLDGRLLAIHLGDHTESSMPFVLHDEAIISRVPEVRFEAEFLANFVSPVSWDDEVIV